MKSISCTKTRERRVVNPRCQVTRQLNRSGIKSARSSSTLNLRSNTPSRAAIQTVKTLCVSRRSSETSLWRSLSPSRKKGCLFFLGLKLSFELPAYLLNGLHSEATAKKPSLQDLLQFWFRGPEVVEMRCSKCDEAGESDVGHTYGPSSRQCRALPNLWKTASSGFPEFSFCI